MIRRTPHRMNACMGLLILLLAFIWGNSLLPGNISGAISDWVKQLLKPLLRLLFGNTSGDGGGGLLRKIAHFTEFAALGACFCWLYAMLMSKQPRQIILSAVSGFLAACVDETIQRFVPDRHGCLTDVGIDTAGVITGIVLFTIAYYINKNNQLNLEEIQ